MDWEKVLPFREIHFHEEAGGYIVWRLGTGGNVELLHLRAHEPGTGVGERLLRAMVAELELDPPYETVFGFTRVSNTAARDFYAGMGFDLTVVKGVYRDGAAVVFSQRYESLRERLL